MLSKLRRHPIPMQARFEHCLVLTYAYPAELLRPLLPDGLTVDAYGPWGFLAVAMMQARRMRPAGFPPWVGADFFLCGYRVFTRYRSRDGRTLRGLRILRSDADRRPMVLGGNLLTRYNYNRVLARCTSDGGSLRVRVCSLDGRADVDVIADLAAAPELPMGSPFECLRDARRFAGPLPFTFDYEPETDSIVMIKGARESWSPRLVPVEVRRCSFLDAPPLGAAPRVLASAFYVSGIGYRWERGRRESLGGGATP
jgi:hypothetical protein